MGIFFLYFPYHPQATHIITNILNNKTLRLNTIMAYFLLYAPLIA